MTRNKIKKSSKNWLCFAMSTLLILLLNSCVKELLDSDKAIPESGVVKVKLRIDIPERNIVSTRATPTTGDDIDHLVVMTFDADGNMTDAPQEADVDDADKTLYFATLNATVDKRIVVIIVNSNVALTNYTTSFGEWKVMGTSGVDENNATTLEHLKDNLQKTLLSIKTIDNIDYITEQPLNAPMSAEVELPDGISRSLVIRSSNGSAVELERATAKFTVEVPTPIAGFMIDGVSLCNAPRTGYVFRNSKTDLQTGTMYNYINPISTNASYVPLAGRVDNNTSEALFGYQIDASMKPFVVLKASYNGTLGYYRLNLVDGTVGSATRTQLSVERNKWYKINISKVLNKGYDTFAEAVANPPSNIESIVTVTSTSDPSGDAHDIVFNGQYYLGLSNSKFDIYRAPDAELHNIVVATLHHNTPTTVKKAKVTVPIGITLVPTTGLATNGTLTANSTAQTVELRIDVASTFSSGKIVIELGNIYKEIDIAVKDNTLTYATKNISFPATTSNSILVGAPNWMSLWSVGATTGVDFLEEIGEFDMKIDANLTDVDRVAYWYHTETNAIAGGRAKSVIIQPIGTTWTVTFSANGATGSVPAPITANTLSNVVMPNKAADLIKGTRYFSGWNTAADGSGTNYNVGSSNYIMPAGGATLYARWLYLEESEEIVIPNSLLSDNVREVDINVSGGNDNTFQVVSVADNWVRYSIVNGKLRLVADKSPNSDPRTSTITLLHNSDPNYKVTIKVAQYFFTDIPPFDYFLMQFTWTVADMDVAVEFNNNKLISGAKPLFDNIPVGMGFRSQYEMVPSYVKANGVREAWGSGTLEEAMSRGGLLFWGGDPKSNSTGESVFFNASLVDNDNTLERYVKLDVYNTWFMSPGNATAQTPINMTISAFKGGTMTYDTSTRMYNGTTTNLYLDVPKSNPIRVSGYNGPNGREFVTSYQKVATITYDRKSHKATVQWYK